MTTITLKINERTKAGKAFMAMVKFFAESEKQAVMIEEPYNPEFVAMVKKAAKSKNRTRIDPSDVWASL